jgi:hypothetical protein
LPKFAVAVVDEGQHVFSAQTEAAIEGQHAVDISIQLTESNKSLSDVSIELFGKPLPETIAIGIGAPYVDENGDLFRLDSDGEVVKETDMAVPSDMLDNVKHAGEIQRHARENLIKQVAVVSQLFELCLCTSPRLFVFHDPNQSTSVVPPQYPTDLIAISPFQSIIRNPGRVRDVTIPFCGSLESGSEKHGTVVFHPLHSDVPLGPNVQICDVKSPDTFAENPWWDDYAQHLKDGTLRVCKENMDWIIAYSAAVAQYLDGLYKEADAVRRQKKNTSVMIGKKGEILAGALAVLLPSTIGVASVESIRRETAAKVNQQEIRIALEDGGNIDWCVVENFSGMESPFVVLTGFHMPAHLLSYAKGHLKSLYSPSQSNVGASRADPSFYLGATRCTFQLTVIEPEAHTFLSRYLIAEAKGGEVQHSTGGAGGIHNTATIIAGSHAIRMVLVIDDLMYPPPLVVMQAARTIECFHCTEGIAFEGPRFEGCTELMHLELVGCLKYFGTPKDPLDGSLGRPAMFCVSMADEEPKVTAYPVLETLKVSTLTELIFLNLADNNLVVSQVVELGNLTALRTLVLTKNNLECVPHEFSRLKKLSLLHLAGNKLRFVPSNYFGLHWSDNNLHGLSG